MTHGVSLAAFERSDERIVNNAFSHNTLNNVVNSIDLITEQSVNDLTLLGAKDINHS